MHGKKTAILIQARMSSNRFPGKMMAPLGGVPLIEYIYIRCKNSSVDEVVVATSENHSDDLLYEYCKKSNIPVMRGSLDNVLNRCIKVAELIGAAYTIRVCGDTPFVDTSLSEMLLKILEKERLDYASIDKKTCAPGFYSEAVTLHGLKMVEKLTSVKEDLEHVTKYIIDHKERFLTRFIKVDLNPEYVRKVGLTIDYPEDITRANMIVNELKDKFLFTSEDILHIVDRKALR